MKHLNYTDTQRKKHEHVPLHIQFSKIVITTERLCLGNGEKNIKIKIIHIWILAVISYIFSLIMGFNNETLGALIFSILYICLLVSTKWAN